MLKLTLIAPRSMWSEILHTLEPIPQATALWFREMKPNEVLRYPPDIESEREHWIYNVSIQHNATETTAEVMLLEARLQTKWPYVQADKESSR